MVVGDSMKKWMNSSKIPLLMGLSFLCVVILWEFIQIMRLNHGHFVYLIDDAYIHLAMAENILKFHYGVNIGEFSAPSSSIIWPFLLAPVSGWAIAPFIINTVCTGMTVYVFFRILSRIFPGPVTGIRTLFLAVVQIILILEMNLIGLLFLGIEHSLQILSVSLIVLGLLKVIETDRCPGWFGVAIVTAPLVRYESLTISVAAIIFLLMRKMWRYGLILLLGVAGFLLDFSVFLIHLGLKSVPTSVLARSSVVYSHGAINSVFENLRRNLNYETGLILVAGMFILLISVAMISDEKRRQLAVVTIIAVLIHMLAGSFDRYRYEIYIWCFFCFISMLLADHAVRRMLESNWKKMLAATMVMCLAGYLCVAFRPRPESLSVLPLACNNIYEQHYQMHRFCVEYYRKPVAVNDLGYVSYQNDQDVLDLAGLASIEALHWFKIRDGSDWMQTLAVSRSVECAMIYESWFAHIPETWVRIGELRLGKKQIAAAGDAVAFYALNRTAQQEITELLKAFIPTLPEGVSFVFNE